MHFVSYAQNKEDVLLWRALQNIEAGFYIDVGAAHPRHDSVTLAFYERGWHGINIDPEPENINALQAARPRDINLQLAVGTDIGSARFHYFPGTGWSTLNSMVAARHRAHGHQPEERIVETQTLAAICRCHAVGEIHFLKVDVEGSEAQVIASGDFTSFRPWIIVVEATVPDSSEPVPRDWEPTLTAAGYKLAQFDGLNCFYVAEEHAAKLLPVLATPVNLFDKYISVKQIELAQAVANSGFQVPGLASAGALEAAERKAREAELRILAQETELKDAKRKARDAEFRMLAQETEYQLMRAEAVQVISSSTPINLLAEAVATQSGARKLFFDATLMLHHGFLSAVGLVRVEHYVAEYLALDPAVALDFVVYDRECNAYRAITENEREILEHILFYRYAPPEPKPKDTDLPVGRAANEPRTEPVNLLDHKRVDLPAETTANQPAWHGSRFRRRLRLAASLTPVEFEEVLCRRARQHFPVLPAQNAVQRAGTRLLRRVVLAGARCSYRGVVAAAAVRCRLVRFVDRLIAPDPEATPQLQPQRQPLFQPQPEIPSHNYAPFKFGDVLISMANTWDYMNYHYLAKIVRDDGIRFICVLYDVVGMELPFVTPAPAHHYHHHWVEIGHISERIIAISRFSAESYDRFIVKPNGLDVPVDYALLPNFLQERATQIGETPLQDLVGQNFVIYCSTIEIRKNHILLLHLWEELRQRIAPEKLPILVFVGKWGWSTETVRLLFERNWRLRPHLRVMSEVCDAELIWLYRRARFTVFPSLSEGFGLAASESLSFGTPVVISKCPALQEATEHLMPAFHPHDFMGWLEELERLILDDAHLATLRKAATRFRGPAYDAFAAKIRDAALMPRAIFRPQAQSSLSRESAA